MDDKIKELFTIGASMSTHYQKYLTFHIAKARNIGGAITTGKLVRSGSIAEMNAFAETTSNPATPSSADTRWCSGTTFYCC